MRVKTSTVQAEDRLSLRLIGAGGINASVVDDGMEAEATFRLAQSPGTDYFVDAATGDDASNGLSWEAALETVAAALTKCVDGHGDTVYVKPTPIGAADYAENLVLTGKDNVHLVGVLTPGNSMRVTIAPAAGIALDLAQSDGFAAIGVRFVGVSAVGVRSDGEGAYFASCDFTSDTSHGFQFLGATNTDNTGSGTDFDGCIFRECGGAGLRSSKGTGVCLGLQATNVNVRNSQFYLNTGDDIDDDAGSGSPTYFYQWEISGCKFMTRNKADAYLDMDGGVSAECLICGNWFANDGVALTSTQVQLATGAVFVGNFDANGVRDGSAL